MNVENPEEQNWWCLIETSGNQAFIYASNRLRENRGASGLVADSCTTWVIEAIQSHPDVTPVVITSGRALLQASTARALETVVTTVTKRALIEAPGLTVTGAIGREPTDPEPGDTTISAVIRTLGNETARIAAANPATNRRFPRQPLLASCGSSQFPAEHVERDGNSSAVPLSEVSQRKRLNADKTTSVNDLESRVRSTSDIAWLAVIHADGNSVGKLFIDLGRWCAATEPSNSLAARTLHLETLAGLSSGLRTATSASLTAATMAVGESNVMRVVEGGDDVTVICDGSQAIEFTRVYLETFEHMTAAIMREICERIGNSDIPSFLTACAGIAIIKPHFPFFISQEIAEALTTSAKAHSRDSVQAISSLDFHLVSDSAQTELRSIRAGRRSDNQEVRLWGGPYTVRKSSLSNLRDVEWLQRAVEAARATDEEGRRILPRSTAMKIKQALFAGPDVAAQVARESVASVPSAILDSSSLVRKDEDEMSSAFVDILDLVDLGPGGSE